MARTEQAQQERRLQETDSLPQIVRSCSHDPDPTFVLPALSADDQLCIYTCYTKSPLDITTQRLRDIGSIASRNPSPMKLTASVKRVNAMLGKRIRFGLVLRPG